MLSVAPRLRGRLPPVRSSLDAARPMRTKRGCAPLAGPSGARTGANELPALLRRPECVARVVCGYQAIKSADRL